MEKKLDPIVCYVITLPLSTAEMEVDGDYVGIDGPEHFAGMITTRFPDEFDSYLEMRAEQFGVSKDTLEVYRKEIA